MKESMFCFQCQETAKGTGCTVRGVCGKNSTTSARMDLLLFVIRAISIAAHTLRTHRILPDPQVNAFVIDALFSTITNANFDEKSITERINRGFNLRNRLVAQASSAGITFPSADELTWNGAPEAYDDKAAEVGVLREPNEDLRSLKELIVYGLKGISLSVTCRSENSPPVSCKPGHSAYRPWPYSTRPIPEVTVILKSPKSIWASVLIPES